MAVIAPQSVEELSDRIIYRYPGGRYDQALTNWNGALTSGQKTLVNTDTTRSYSVPASGIPARFFSVDLYFTTSVVLKEILGVNGNMNVVCGFFSISIPTLNYDGRTLQTDFYQPKTTNYIPSTQLRAINLSNILVDPIFNIGEVQFTALSGFGFSNGASETQLIAIIQPIVTMYKK